MCTVIIGFARERVNGDCMVAIIMVKSAARTGTGAHDTPLNVHGHLWMLRIQRTAELTLLKRFDQFKCI